MIFLDTGVIIAASMHKDESHYRAVELIKDALLHHETLVITDHVLDETVTFLAGKAGKKIAHEVGARLLKSTQMRMELCSLERCEAALSLVAKIGGLSFCDALNIAVMRELDIRAIYSFDSDFDGIAGITRIE